METLDKTIRVLPVSSREAFFEKLYESAFPAFAHFAARMNASFQDAKDIFHDALVIYYEKSLAEDFVIHTTPEAYVVGIARHLWIRKFKRDRRNISLDAAEAQITLPPDYFPTVDESRLLKFVERAGKRCLDLLQRFYYEKAGLREIAQSLGYRSERSAAVQKHKCIGKMRDAIKAKAIDYEDFTF